jgi:hypothetical protein
MRESKQVQVNRMGDAESERVAEFHETHSEERGGLNGRLPSTPSQQNDVNPTLGAAISSLRH